MHYIWVVFLLTTLAAEDIAHFTQQVLDTYIKYCGIEYTCNLDKNSEKYVNQSFDVQLRCQWCICDKQQCTHDHYCCPDITVPQVSTEDFENWNLRHFSISVIDICPANANDSLIEMCSKNWRDITDEEFNVVYGRKSGNIMVYKNKYCALCNGIIEWKILKFKLSCEKSRFPLNTFSSKHALLSGASKYGCEIKFEDIGFVNGDLIYSCNVTGKWDHENTNIEWACRNYGTVPYSIFKNIFCYVCNTGLLPRQPYIDNCISHVDTVLENMCLFEGVDARFYPFKNQYCKTCNKLSSWVFDFRVQAIRIPYEEYANFEWQIITYPKLCYIRHLDSYKFLKISTVMDSLCNENVLGEEKRKSLQKEFDDHYQINIARRQSRFMNITSLYEKYRQMIRSSPLCFSPIGNKTAICSCDLSCFSEGNCCPDMVLFSTESSCIDLVSYSPSNYAKCKSSFPDKILQYYCERKEEEYESFMDYISFVHKNNVEYKNLFCKICSEPDEAILSNGDMREVKVKCREFVDVENYLRSGKSVMELRDICNVRLEPMPRNSMLQPANHQCPDNVSKDISASDLLYLCTWAGNFIYSTCKSKYKNVFCQMYHMYQDCANGCTYQSMQSYGCNETEDTGKMVEGDYPVKFTFNPASLRPNMTTHISGNCMLDEFYDEEHYKCRVIKCIQGKFFFNGKCVPLLQNTTRLGYHAEMIATVMNPEMDGTKSTKNIVLRLLHNFRETLFKSTNFILAVSKITVMAPAPCNSSWIGIMNTEKMNDILLDIQIETMYKEIVHRQQLDELLLETMSKAININVYGIEFQVRIPNYSSPHGNWLKRNQVKNCFTSWGSRILKQTAHYFEIDKFLVCSQIALDKGKYQLVNSRVLLVQRLGHRIKMQFTLGSDDEVLVCISDYLASFSVATPLKTALVSSTMILSILFSFFP